MVQIKIHQEFFMLEANNVTTVANSEIDYGETGKILRMERVNKQAKLRASKETTKE